MIDIARNREKIYYIYSFEQPKKLQETPRYSVTVYCHFFEKLEFIYGNGKVSHNLKQDRNEVFESSLSRFHRTTTLLKNLAPDPMPDVFTNRILRRNLRRNLRRKSIPNLRRKRGRNRYRNMGRILFSCQDTHRIRRWIRSHIPTTFPTQVPNAFPT